MFPVYDNDNPTLAANAARMASIIRPGSENVHAPLKHSNKHLGGKVHNSRLDAVGQPTLAHYNNRYGMNYGQEWAEAPKLLIEYLVTAGLYNQFHPKFHR